ncbi:AL2 [Tomato bright yellow mosaic virus]|uniref:AL2 n=1 Tax=Tomato bright yellow mosaic virus TaxID=1340746 RepID=R9S7V3_9GEMI|nr:AL2 [Tomato bright yellow mosaic virus]AGN12887.1 AL2 [Tomato bright yellow mosaic virus]
MFPRQRGKRSSQKLDAPHSEIRLYQLPPLSKSNTELLKEKLKYPKGEQSEDDALTLSAAVQFIFTLMHGIWIHAQGNTSLHLRHRMAYISGKFQIPFISRSSTWRIHHTQRPGYITSRYGSTTTPGKRWVSTRPTLISTSGRHRLQLLGRDI